MTVYESRREERDIASTQVRQNIAGITNARSREPQVSSALLGSQRKRRNAPNISSRYVAKIIAMPFALTIDTFALIIHAKRKDANLDANNVLDTVKLIPAQKTIATSSVRTTLHFVISMLVSIVDVQTKLGLVKD